MEKYNLDDQLKELKDTEMTAIPEVVRARLDSTYASLADQPFTPVKNSTASWKRWTVSVTAAAAMLGVGVYTTALVSPAMAESLKQIPLIGSIFSSIQVDSGLQAAGVQGLTTSVTVSDSFEGITMGISEVIFDGTRAAFAVKINAPQGIDGKFYTGEKGNSLDDAIEEIFVSIDGKEPNAPDSPVNGVFYGAAGKEHPDTMTFEINDRSGENPSLKLPDSFTATFYVELKGVDHKFKLEVPVKRTVQHAVRFQPKASRTHNGLTFSVTDVEMTSATTNLAINVKVDEKVKVEEKKTDEIMEIEYALFDDQEHQVDAVSGEGMFDKNQLIQTERYVSVKGKPHYLIVRPYIDKDDDEKASPDEYIKELELKIEVPAQK
ncbi:MAG TPA: DUF4179 domain-containing protein [Candidatus Bathyarchaeia archaeon]|nr:DUF4179 domain-containing protein [Candidatus Bathyarchaeia archaeon]